MNNLIKMLVLSALLFLPAERAAARFYAGGNIAIGHSGSDTYLRIAPDLGWNFTNFNVGGKMSFSTNSTNFSVTPYFRWYFLPIFELAKFSLSFNAPISKYDGQTSVGAIFRPGLSLRLSEKFWLSAQFGNFGYYWYPGSNTGQWMGKLTSDTISIGFMVNL